MCNYDHFLKDGYVPVFLCVKKSKNVPSLGVNFDYMHTLGALINRAPIPTDPTHPHRPPLIPTEPKKFPTHRTPPIPAEPKRITTNTHLALNIPIDHHPAK